MPLALTSLAGNMMTIWMPFYLSISDLKPPCECSRRLRNYDSQTAQCRSNSMTSPPLPPLMQGASGTDYRCTSIPDSVSSAICTGRLPMSHSISGPRGSPLKEAAPPRSSIRRSEIEVKVWLENADAILDGSGGCCRHADIRCITP